MKHTDRLCSLALCCIFLLTGCAETVTEYAPGSDGRYHKVGTFTPEESWRRMIDKEIAQERAGTLQKGPYATAREYWQHYYRLMRSYSDADWKSLGMETSVDRVAYIKQKRREAGLPTYD